MKDLPDRDQSIDRLLRQTFAASQADVSDSCLDAESIAAWSDGLLSGQALAAAESHVADCPRCRAIVGTMARATTVVREPEPVRRRWLMWAAPLTAAAAIAAMVFAIRHESGRRPELIAESERRNDTVIVERPSAGNQSREVAPAPQTEQPSARVERDRALSDGRNQAPGQRQEQESQSRRLSEVDQQADKVEPLARADSSSAAAAAAPASPPPPPARETAQRRSVDAFAAKLSSAGVVITSPNPAIRFRLAGRNIERTDDGGSSWETVLSGAPGDLTAGAAPSDTVCWVVGRAGVIFLSIDGRRFSRVPFAQTTDLISVRASDAQTASVSTGDGRTFTTADAGTTWK